MPIYLTNPEAALAILGALDARARNDNEGAAMVLYPWHESGQTDQLLGACFALLAAYQEAFSAEVGIDPATDRDLMRGRIIDGTADL